jgi:PAS domain S-box-containing protein
VRTNLQTERLLGYSARELINKPVELLLPEPCREHFRSETAPALTGTEAEPFATAKDGRKLPVEVSRSPIETDTDYTVCIALRDVSERKHAEERQHLLIAELDHRVKNILATVSVVARHTRKDSASMVEFLNALDGRIQSMARAHALLRQGCWQGVNLTDLVREELAPCATQGNTQFEGPDVVLIPDAVPPVAMVLHELVTNAAKYGALPNHSGRVSVRWQWLQNGSHDRLLIEWQETGGPPVLAPSRSGYGTSIIRELIPFELGGLAEPTFAREGTQCRLEIPGEWTTGPAKQPSTERVPFAPPREQQGPAVVPR